MSIVVTVRVAADPVRVERIESEHPGLMDVIKSAAQGRMRVHRRLGRVGETLDLDEFDSVADYEAFHAEAGEAIQALADEIGTPYRDTVFEAR